MSVTVLATPLQPGQLIRDWKRSYLSGVALLTPAQKKDVLPLYVNRSTEEQDIAYEAIKLDTVELALTMLEEFIDGTPSPYVSTQMFFDAKCPAKPSLIEQTRFFMQVRKLGTDAGFSEKIIMSKFLAEIPAGKKLYGDNKAKLIDELTAEESTTLFKKMKTKLEESSTEPAVEPVKVKQERDEAFAVEEVVPVWAKELRDDFKVLRNKVDDLVLTDSETDDEETYYYKKEDQRNDTRRKPLICYICDQPGHIARDCYKRQCSICKRQGHSAKDCPGSKLNPGKKEPYNKDSYKRDSWKKDGYRV